MERASPTRSPVPFSIGRNPSITEAMTEVSRSASLSPAVLQALRQHVINLKQGQLSTDGVFQTSPDDLRKIFSIDLEQALNRADNIGRPLRIVLFAHGGLVSETSGLSIAHKHVDWWITNGIYPLYFVWETGLLGSIMTYLGEAAAQIGIPLGRTRDIFERFSDPIIDSAARALGVDKVWSGMKRSAERASYEEGGGFQTAKLLENFISRNTGKQIELHAVGHSAGAIFLGHLAHRINDKNLPLHFESIHLLAPAITTEMFKETFKSWIGNQAAKKTKISVFTMTENFERRDEVAGLYRKSLLYFVSNACEEKKGEQILGLEGHLRRDYDLVDFFGLERDAPKDNLHQVVFSQTADVDGRDASRSTTHGEFDDDPSTMNSVLRRILKKDNNEGLDQPYQNNTGSRSARANAYVDFEEEVLFARSILKHNRDLDETSPEQDVRKNDGPAELTRPADRHRAARKVALCIGINDYPTNALRFCESDSNRWAEVLEGYGFKIVGGKPLAQEETTREIILRELRKLVGNSKAGDVIVFQYAGHGAFIRDTNVLLPIDYGDVDGRMIFDYEIKEIINETPKGVNITTFMDSCHSETSTRSVMASFMALGSVAVMKASETMIDKNMPRESSDFKIIKARAVGAPIDGEESIAEIIKSVKLSQADRPRARFIDLNNPEKNPEPLSKDIVDAVHRQAKNKKTRPNTRARGVASDMRNVTFAACTDMQQAFEFRGSGRFTFHAINVIKEIDGRPVTNQEFIELVKKSFMQEGVDQNPEIDSTEELARGMFMQPLKNEIYV